MHMYMYILILRMHASFIGVSFKVILHALHFVGDLCSDEMRTKSGSSSKKEDKEDIFHTLLSSLDDEEGMHLNMG